MWKTEPSSPKHPMANPMADSPCLKELATITTCATAPSSHINKNCYGSAFH